MLKGLLLFTISFSFCFTHQNSGSTISYKKENKINLQKENEKARKIKNHIQEYVKRGEFNGAVLVAKRGEIIFKGGFGYANVEKKIPNRSDTKFLIGSTTKSISAILLLRFYERGLVNLNSPISKYLPNLRKELGEKLTIDILLRMKSGLPNHLARLTSIDDRKITTVEVINIINRSQFDFQPGTKYKYSNLNYTLIAAILEKISGKSYAQLLQEEIFSPLGMKNSASGGFETIKNKKALGYHVKSLKLTEKNNLYFAIGSGSVYSTVEDLFKLDQALYTDDLLSKTSKEKAFRGGTKEFGYYGYGFRIRKYDRGNSLGKKGVLVRHGGTMKGYLANFHRYLDDQITVIILGNISMFPIRKLTNELKDIALVP